MAGKSKEINKNEVFLNRFRELESKDPKSLDDLGSIFGASRQTVSKWMSGDSIPNIEALVKMANFYHVSADYLLGLSDTVSADVNVKAAVEYTGLSEAAVEGIHSGFVRPKRFRLKLSEGAAREEKLFVASHLLQSLEFGDVLDHLVVLSELSFFESIMVRLEKQHWKYETSVTDTGKKFLTTKEHGFILAAIRNAHQKGRLFQGEGIIEQIAEMNDVELVKFLEAELSDIQSKMALRQFLVTKEFNHYIERLLKITYSNARKGLRD